MASKRKQIINPLVGFGQRAIGPYANRIGQSTYARNVNVGELELPADFQAFGELNGVIKALIRGQGSVTFGRSSEATVRDFEGLLNTALVNEIRFEGGRRVENIVGNDSGVTNTEDMTSAGWTYVRASAVYQGGGVTRITATDPVGVLRSDSLFGDFTDSLFRIGIDVRRISGTGEINLYDPNGATKTNIGPSLTSEFQRFSTNGAGGASFTRFRIDIDDSGGVIEVRLPMHEEVTGQANTNPSEYVSKGVVSSDQYHGVNVDGVKVFAYENGNTVDGNLIVTEAKGAAITDYRALFEPGVTSYINEPADFTLGANWVADGFAGTSQSSLDSSLKGFKLWRLEETTGSTGTRGITSNVHTKAAQAELWHAEIIARPDQIGWIKLGIENSAETSYVFQFFNLSTGAVGGNLALNWGHVRGESEQLANGDWRFRVFGVTNNETSIRLRCNLAETDNDDFFNVPAGDGCYIQAANLKQEDAASSFVYSTGGSGSRSADVPSPMFDFGNFSQTEGTWYMDVWFALFQSEVIGLFSVANNESNVLYKGGTASFRTSDSNGSPASTVNIVGATAYNRYRAVAEFSQSDTLDIGYRDIDGLGVFAWDGAPESYGGAFPTNNVMNICYDIGVPVRIRDFQGFTTRKGRTWVENNL